VSATPTSSVSELPSIEEAHILLPKTLRDELILLYFRHIHPLCPFIDEYRFSEDYYSADSDEELLEKIDVCLFQAMMFTAFTVSILRRMECQLFDSLNF